MKLWKTLFIIVALIMPLSLHPTATLGAKQETSRIIAEVNGVIILASELEARVKLVILTSGFQDTAETRAQLTPQILKVMIEEALQVQRAAQFKIEPKAAEIDQAFRDLEARNNMSEGELDDFLKKNSLPKKIIRDQLRSMLAWRAYIQDRYQPEIPVTEQEIDLVLAHFKDSKEKPQVLLAEIVLPIDTPQQDQETYLQAKRLVEQLQQGADFGKVAQQFSRAASAAKNGEIGWHTFEQLEKPLVDAITSLSPGEVSAPIKTQSAGAYRIVHLIDRREAGEVGKPETLITFQQVLFPLEPSTSEIKMQQTAETANRIRQSAKSCRLLETLTKGIGQSKNVKEARLSDMPPPLQSLLKPLPVGALSEPIGIRDLGLLLFMVCDKKEVKPEDPTRNDIRRNIIQDKMGLFAQRELRNLRRSGFIDIRS